MKTQLRLYIVLLLLILSAIIIADLNKPKEIDWTPTYALHDKNPLGLYIFDRESTELLGDVEKLSVTPYEYFDALFDYDTLVNTYSVTGSFIDISDADNLDPESLSEIIYFVGHGNTAFLSTRTYPAALLDSLDVQMQFDYTTKDSIAVWLANPIFKGKEYYVREGAGLGYFTAFDSLRTTILGYQRMSQKMPNFIKVAYRQGYFYLHTQPAVFTNYYLLKKDYDSYAAGALSYVPNEKVFWYSRNKDDTQLSQSPMRYVLDQPALASAWYLFLVGMVFFMFFNAKRKQRVVPIIKPLENTTIDFTKTIANLYQQEGDYDTIIDKKIIYFLEKIRNEYLLDTSRLNEEFARRYAQKSGKDQALINDAFNKINAHRRSRHTSIESDLIEINNAIEKII